MNEPLVARRQRAADLQRDLWRMGIVAVVAAGGIAITFGIAVATTTSSNGTQALVVWDWVWSWLNSVVGTIAATVGLVELIRGLLSRDEPSKLFGPALLIVVAVVISSQSVPSVLAIPLMFGVVFARELALTYMPSMQSNASDDSD